MNHYAAPSFWQCYDGLPESVRALADKQFDLLKADPRHPSLHFKRVGRFHSSANKRVKLAPQALQGTIGFVTIELVRRSLRAIH